MEYKTIFLITEESYKIAPIVLLITSLIIIILLFKYKSIMSRFVFNVLTIFIAIFMLFVSYGTFYMSAFFKNEYNEHHYQIINGFVENYQVMPNDGKGYEKFSVRNIYFFLSDSLETGGFNETDKIHNGMKVKIYYLDHEYPEGKVILRLDIKR